MLINVMKHSIVETADQQGIRKLCQEDLPTILFPYHFPFRCDANERDGEIE